MWNLKKSYKLTYLQNRGRLINIENKLMVTKGKKWRRDKLGIWEQHIHITIYKTDKQQGPCLAQGTIFDVLK